MTCRELSEFLMAYLDDELDPTERRVFEGHMELCPPCKAYLKSYRETIRLGKLACVDPEGPPPPDVPERLVQAVLAARRRSAS